MQSYTPRNILVTGGCGFIASHLVNTLVEKYPQYNIINIDKIDTCSSERNCERSAKCPNYKFIKGDITSTDLLNYVLKNEAIDTVIHAAAQSHVDSSFGNSFTFTHNNVYGTHVLLESCKQYGGVRRFIHVSTDEVYGSCDDERKHEESATNPTNPYAASKAAAESIVRGYINSFKFPAIITRGNNVYGPGQYVEKLIAKMTIRLLRNRKCCIHGDGSNRRHFLHVSDTVSAFDTILHRGTLGETYNIGSPDEFKNIDVVRKMIGLLKPGCDEDDWIEYVHDRSFNDTRYFLTYEKLTSLGWHPKVNFDEGLASTVQWYRSIQPETYWSSKAVHAIEPHPIG
jgi:dTDP-glucose 4,6-dehydratase